MILILNEPRFSYEMQNICRLFFPYERIDLADTADSTDLWAKVLITHGEKETAVACEAFAFGQSKQCRLTVEKSAADFEKQCEIAAGVGLYRLFSELCGFSPKWGVLTGVRPEKLLSQLTEKFNSVDAAMSFFTRRLLVAPEKADLCLKSYHAEQKALAFNAPNAFSLYISIPFCPTRCSYCSFVSHSIANAGKLVPDYVDLLCREIAETGKIAKELGLRLTTVYWGGGTPTQLNANQLDRVMTAITQSFDSSGLQEYTVEAGRPDTITAAKLRVIRSNGCGRISINPQTMHDSVLEAIGRKHTVAQTIEAFQLARSEGFGNINMDLIAGLPTDTVDGFRETMDEILSLSPENITVHTLALKRSSTLVESGAAVYAANSKIAADMLDISSEKLYDNRYSPYYLYRQSKMLGNLENVGWSKSGFDCLYNIYMMNEIHTVLGVGAGAVSRLKNQNTGEIQRVFNYKYPYEYINRFDELIARKSKVGEFYETFHC